MKHFAAYVCILLLYTKSSAQKYPEVSIDSSLNNSHWNASNRIDGKFDEIILNRSDTTRSIHHSSYYHLDFKPGNQFISYNVPGCGMDCVKRILGHYIAGHGTIELFIDSVFTYKHCAAPPQKKDEGIGIYYLIKDEFGLRIVAYMRDEPEYNYAQQSGIEIPSFKNKEANRLMRRFVYVYNRSFQVYKNKSREKYRRMVGDNNDWYQSADVHKNKINKQEKEKYIAAINAMYQALDKLSVKLDKEF